MSLTAIQRIEATISRLIFFKPIFGSIFLYLNKIESEETDTMGIGVVRKVDLGLYYNSEFVNSLTDDELYATLIHESLHIMLHHLNRVKYGLYSYKVFNIAADLAINSYIDNLPDIALYPKDFGFEPKKSAEYYYSKIKENPILRDKIDKLETLDHHDMWKDMDSNIISEKIKRVAKKAIDCQNDVGWRGIDSSLSLEIISKNTNRVSWIKELRYFVSKISYVGKRCTYKKPNRRTGEKYPYLHKGFSKNYISKILVAIDTSGSVTDKQLQSFFSELNNMIKHVRCDYICFDTKVYGSPIEVHKKIKKFNAKGRGGTDFAPVIALADSMRYDGLVIFTDGEADVPKKPKTRVLWAIYNKNISSIKFPYGKKINVNSLIF